MRRPLLAVCLTALVGCQHAAPVPAAGAAAGSPSPGPDTSAAGAQADAKASAAASSQASANAAADQRRIERPALVRALAEEAHALFKAEGELFWRRWTTGQGAQPATAAEGHGRLFEAASLQALAEEAQAAADPRDALALRLLHGQLATRAIARAAAAEADALDRARAQLAFTPAGSDKAEHERDLDRLLLDEPTANGRARLAVAEAKAAAALEPLVAARDAAYEKARAALSLPSWDVLIEELHRAPPAQLAALADRTLADTQDVAERAVAWAALRNLGSPADRVHRADLPRLLRLTSADPEFQPGQAFRVVGKLLAAIGAPQAALDKVGLDAEPRPGKGARPLALLIDPPADVRLSYRGVGGLDEQRAMLHEAARALGGALIDPAQRWELSQLGDGAAAEGIARLFEELAGSPSWLRASTKLRGEPLDDLVHTQATRRLLALRRAAALVLFEVRRREGTPSSAELAKLYRGLLQRATFATFTDEDSRRWPLEADSFIRAAATLQGELLSAQLEIVLRREAGDRSGAAGALDRPRPEAEVWEDDSEEAEADAEPVEVSSGATSGGATSGGATSGDTAGPPPRATASPAAPAPTAPTAPYATPAAASPSQPEWWRSSKSGALLRRIWSLGRSASASDVLRALGLSSMDPYLFAAVAEEQLGYRAPERPPEPPRPDYKEMRGDRKPARKKKKRRAR